jgi:hypothetical protein
MLIRGTVSAVTSGGACCTIGFVNFSAARVVSALREFVTAVKQISEGYAQGPPGC